MPDQVKIGDRIIGESLPLFIIAEIGITCNYDLSITKELINAARDAGADAVKFIFWFPEEIMSDKTITYSYDTIDGPRTENMFEMLTKLSFSLEEWQEIKAYADRQGIIMSATVNSPGGIGYARALGLAAIKLSSWDYNYLPLYRQVAALGKPLVMDLGPVNLLELARVIQIIHEAGNKDLVLLHCCHTKIFREINLRTIPYLKNTFEIPVGFSSEGREDELDILALGLGAVVLEKRLTLSRSLPGHHHVIAKEPQEFSRYVQMMHNLKEALGSYGLRPSQADLEERQRWFRHLVADRDIPRGTVLTEALLAGKRPEKGVSPAYLDLLVGRKTRRDLKYNQALTWEDV